MRHPTQRSLAFPALRRNNHARLIIRDLLARPLEQLRMHSGWQRPRRPARGSGFVSGKLKADEDAVLGEEGRDAGSPLGAERRGQGAKELPSTESAMYCTIEELASAEKEEKTRTYRVIIDDIEATL